MRIDSFFLLKPFCLVSILMTLLLGQRAFALSERDTAHLIGRTGFGLASLTWSDFKYLDRTEAVDFLLSMQKFKSTTADPSFVGSGVYKRLFSGKLSKAEKKLLRRNEVNEHRRELAEWWWTEMLSTESVLVERMVLFWHGHFTSDIRKTHAPFIYEQNQLFRKYAFGDFRVLMREVIKGPAMQLFLDNTKNRKGRPNENLARELLELFTLGVGHYTEHDVREVARALTGWKVNKERTAMLFKAKHHDAGEKTILGKTGKWAMQDVLDILLQLPRTAEFLTHKLWREFISPEPDETEIQQLSKEFRESDYSIGVLVKSLLKSDAFWAKNNRSMLVKSPVELAIGVLRDYSIPVNNLKSIIKKVEECGQQLFYPPDVKGWRGDKAWLSTDTIVQRQTLLEQLLKRLKRYHIKKTKFEVRETIRRDFLYFDQFEKTGFSKKPSNAFKELEMVLLNDFYQLK